MDSNEKSIRFIEEHIPDLADGVFKQACWQALAEGSSVLKVENNTIVEIFPDGNRKVVKQIEGAFPVKIQQKQTAS